MQEETEKVDFYQTRPYFFPYKYKVIKTRKNKYIEYSCHEKAVYFEMEFSIKDNCVHMHIVDIVIEPTNSGIGKSVFAYLLKEAVHMCDDFKTENIYISGFLSTEDYNNGRWPDSLLAYKKLGQDFLLDFHITDQETDPTYADCPELLKKEIYTEVKDFFNPVLGKINSGYLHYNGNKTEIEIVLEEYYRFIHEKINAIEEEKTRKYIENQRLIHQGLESSDKSLSLVEKIKRILDI